MYNRTKKHNHYTRKQRYAYKKGGKNTIKMKSKDQENISLSEVLKFSNKKIPKLKFKIVEYNKDTNKVKFTLDFKFPKKTYLSLNTKNVNTVNNTLQKLVDTYFDKDRKKNQDLLTLILNKLVDTSKATTSMITGKSLNNNIK